MWLGLCEEHLVLSSSEGTVTKPKLFGAICSVSIVVGIRMGGAVDKCGDSRVGLGACGKKDVMGTEVRGTF